MFGAIGSGISNLQAQQQQAATQTPSLWTVTGSVTGSPDMYFCKIKKCENGYIVVVNYREYIVDHLDKLPAILVAAEMTK